MHGGQPPVYMKLATRSTVEQGAEAPLLALDGERPSRIVRLAQGAGVASLEALALHAAQHR